MPPIYLTPYPIPRKKDQYRTGLVRGERRELGQEGRRTQSRGRRHKSKSSLNNAEAAQPKPKAPQTKPEVAQSQPESCPNRTEPKSGPDRTRSAPETPQANHTASLNLLAPALLSRHYGYKGHRPPSLNSCPAESALGPATSCSMSCNPASTPGSPPFPFLVSRAFTFSRILAVLQFTSTYL